MGRVKDLAIDEQDAAREAWWADADRRYEAWLDGRASVEHLSKEQLVELLSQIHAKLPDNSLRAKLITHTLSFVLGVAASVVAARFF